VCSLERNISDEVSTPPADAELSRRAARQHGLLTRTQLVDAGLNRHTIAHRVKVGRLHVVHRGVYAVGFRSDAPLPRAMAAVLACGRGAVLSHGSAAALWGIQAAWPNRADTIAATEHRLTGVRVHRSRSLAPQDRTTRLRIPTTTPVRTLIDLADTVDDRILARAVNEALVKRLLRREHLAARLASVHGRRAARRLSAFVDNPDAPTRSVFEDAFLELVDRKGLPRPETNQRVGPYEVDMLWRAPRLIVELDGRAFHDHASAFERDRERDATLVAAGYRVVRVTWRRLADDPDREAKRLRALLGRDRLNSSAGHPPPVPTADGAHWRRACGSP
jgi:very-short-patch-repair endonuclease